MSSSVSRAFLPDRVRCDARLPARVRRFRESALCSMAIFGAGGACLYA